jgi:serine/threonine-protein kinase
MGLVEPITPNRKWPLGEEFTEVKRSDYDFDPTPRIQDRDTAQTGQVTVDEELTSAASTKPEIELVAGMQLGDYVIERKIGQGGMGSVYAAVHPVIGKRAAIKVVNRELSDDEFHVERFVDEARVVNQIGHPNIVDVFAFGETPDGRAYLVMEWLDGQSLRQRIEHATLGLVEICYVVRSLSRALAAAHEHGIVHRDLKPDNVFLVDVRDDRPIVKLLDFGIAKLQRTEHRSAATAAGTLVGTPQYIAPEQAKGEEIDARADIYALGGLLFELLTGRPPFVAESPMEMVAKHVMEPAPRPSTLASVPAELDDLVVAMLAKDPADRPSLATVGAVVDRVKGIVGRADSDSVHSIGDDDSTINRNDGRPAASIPQLARVGRARPRVIVGTLVFGVVIAGVAAFATVWALKDPTSDGNPVRTIEPEAPVGLPEITPDARVQLAPDASEPVQPAAEPPPIEPAGSATNPASAQPPARRVEKRTTNPKPDPKPTEPAEPDAGSGSNAIPKGNDLAGPGVFKRKKP